MGIWADGIINPLIVVHRCYKKLLQAWMICMSTIVLIWICSVICMSRCWGNYLLPVRTANSAPVVYH